MTEPKVVRRNQPLGNAMPPYQVVQKYSLYDPNWYVPFVDDRDYIRADRWDRWSAITIGVAILIVVGLDAAWLMGWLR